MFDRLIDLFINFLELFYIFTVVDQYERAVVLTLGKKRRKVLEPGPHLIWPLRIDQVLKVNVVLETKDLPAQAFTTKDNINAVCSAVVSMTIRDPAKLLLEVEEAETVLVDASRGLIRKTLCSRQWQELVDLGNELDAIITRDVRLQAFNWGIEVHKVHLADFVKAQTVRLIHNGTVHGYITVEEAEEEEALL
jgi:regulator of protease activity HflC (stomatin/prohibitin superfamily)